MFDMSQHYPHQFDQLHGVASRSPWSKKCCEWIGFLEHAKNSLVQDWTPQCYKLTRFLQEQNMFFSRLGWVHWQLFLQNVTAPRCPGKNWLAIQIQPSLLLRSLAMPLRFAKLSCSWAGQETRFCTRKVRWALMGNCQYDEDGSRWYAIIVMLMMITVVLLTTLVMILQNYSDCVRGNWWKHVRHQKAWKIWETILGLLQTNIPQFWKKSCSRPLRQS